MTIDELKNLAQARIAEAIGLDYANSAEAAPLIDAFACSLARGCLVILDSRSQVIYFRNQPAAKLK